VFCFKEKSQVEGERSILFRGGIPRGTGRKEDEPKEGRASFSKIEKISTTPKKIGESIGGEQPYRKKGLRGKCSSLEKS